MRGEVARCGFLSSSKEAQNFSYRRYRYISAVNQSISSFIKPQTIAACKQHSLYQLVEIRGCADMSLARPGNKQATASKLGIYVTLLTKLNTLLSPLLYLLQATQKIHNIVV